MSNDLLAKWMETPIVIRENPVLPGRLFGDDSGYRKMRTLSVNPAPLVFPNIITRYVYEGISPYTGEEIGGALRGGLPHKEFVLREAAARSVEMADLVLREISGHDFKFCGLDPFRSGIRQQDGYSTKLAEQMSMIGLIGDQVDERVADFIGCSIRADGVFSWVKVAQDAVYNELVAELRTIPAILEGARAYAADHMHGGATDDNVADALYEYVIASRNSGIGRAAERGTLVWENNAHAGGGAVDLMIVDRKGVLKAITPFDFPGAFSAYDFLEDPANFDVYNAELAKNPTLQDHLWQCAFDPLKFTIENWNELRAIKRVQYHLARACGWTFYSMGSHGGEHWHEEPGNRVIDPRTGRVIWEEPETAAKYPDRGNPGHSLQKFGPDDVAVWGGATAHTIAKEKFGLEY